jgi:hypothetical protein
MLRLCPCGSGRAREEARDARGIFLTFVCSACRKQRLAGFRAEVLTDAQYEADDLGDET